MKGGFGSFSFQHSVTKVKSLKEELEEVKNHLTTSEEKAGKLLTQNKQLEKENQSLILKISSLQEENIQNALDMSGLQTNIVELSRNVAELQLQMHMYENALTDKDTSLHKNAVQTLPWNAVQTLPWNAIQGRVLCDKLTSQRDFTISVYHCVENSLSRDIGAALETMHCLSDHEEGQEESETKDLDIQELKSTLKEYATIVETLRAEKGKLVSNIQQMQQELISNGINFPLMYKFNSSIFEGTKSLHCELELAQESTITGIEWTALDESLEREVLLLLQGPEQVGEKFKATIRTLREELSQMEELAGLHLLPSEDLETNGQEVHEKKPEAPRKVLASMKTLWLQKLNLLEAQKESLDKELIKLVGNLKRMRTEQLHLKKELSLRQNELESAKQLQEDTVEEGELLRSTLQELTKQLEDANRKMKDQERKLCAACEQVPTLEKKLEGSIAEQRALWAANISLACTYQELEENAKCQSLDLAFLRENHFKGLSRSVLCQTVCCCKGLEPQETSPFSYLSRLPILNGFLPLSPLLDALALDSLQQIKKYSTSKTPTKAGVPPTSKEQLRNGSFSDVTLEGHKGENCPVGLQTDADLRISGSGMEAKRAQEGDAVPLTDVVSREHIPSQDISIPASESADDSHVTETTLLHTMKERICETVSEAEEVNVAAEQETKEDCRNNMEGMTGDSSSAVAVPCIAAERSGQKGIFSVSPTEREVEAEFLRLSLGFKCDLFTLEKRVRLEERSRDLAEGNLKKEIAGALKLLESLASLSEDNQAQEIVKKLQKSLELLSLYASRVASKAEMLGAIHQETRVSKAVEVMIQHVENLKRTYAREHAELEELKEVLFQNEKSFSSSGDRDELSSKKLSNSLKVKMLLRSITASFLLGLVLSALFPLRVSIAALPRNVGNAGSGLPLAPSNEMDRSDQNEKLNRRSSWNTLTEPTPPETKASKAQKLNEKERSSSAHNNFGKANKTLCVSLVAIVVLAILSSLIVGLSFQRPAEAALVGTGNAWTSIQQLLWPYTGLRHEGPPPV
uniref:Uncharacterized protein n=1 Tax=Sphaerodactylus townsendi TaxID=933632 RepID=A0ACB8FM68_9SAUR